MRVFSGIVLWLGAGETTRIGRLVWGVIFGENLDCDVRWHDAVAASSRMYPVGVSRV